MFLETILTYSFLKNAFLGAMLASIACGIVGTLVVEKKLVMMSGGIAHASFGGIGLGYFLNIEPIWGALVFAILAAFGISLIEKKTKTNSDLLIGMFWSFGMALGIIFIAFTPGYPPDMTSYLFGDILTISNSSLSAMLILDLFLIFILFSLFSYLKAFLFDEDFVQVLGIKTKVFNYLLYILIALTIVLLIRLVGIILVIALLTVPTAIAKQFSFNLKTIILLSVLLGIIFCFIGLFLSYQFNIASGATIIVVAVITYLLLSILK